MRPDGVDHIPWKDLLRESHPVPDPETTEEYNRKLELEEKLMPSIREYIIEMAVGWISDSTTLSQFNELEGATEFELDPFVHLEPEYDDLGEEVKERGTAIVSVSVEDEWECGITDEGLFQWYLDQVLEKTQDELWEELAYHPALKEHLQERYDLTEQEAEEMIEESSYFTVWGSRDDGWPERNEDIIVYDGKGSSIGI